MVKKYHISISSLEKILVKYLACSQEELFLKNEIDFSLLEKIEQDILLLSKWYPLAYILGYVEFYGLDFFVNKNTLIPRIDTEILINAVSDFCKQEKKSFYLFDVGTWSWCIALSLNFCFPEYFEKTFCIDISPKAIEIAQKNKEKFSLEKDISLYELDFHFLENILKWDNYEEKDFIFTANLPYIKNSDENLDKNVVLYEPSIALFWGEDTWFEMYQELIEKLIFMKKEKVVKNIDLFMEIWYNQFENSKKFLEEKKIAANYILDTQKIARVIHIKI